jgi:tellurite resistance protein
MHRLTQIQIEGEISDAFPQGKRSEIAGNAHIYPSVMLGWLNPDDERKSPWYQVLAVQAELDEAYPKIGDKVWAAIDRLREAGRPAKLNIGTSELPSLLLMEIRQCGTVIQEASTAIADGRIDKREAEHLIEVLKVLQVDVQGSLDGLHQLLGEIAVSGQRSAVSTRGRD